MMLLISHQDSENLIRDAQETSKQNALLAAVLCLCIVRKVDNSVPQDAATDVALHTAVAGILAARGALLLKRGAFVRMVLLRLAHHLEHLGKDKGDTTASEHRGRGQWEALSGNVKETKAFWGLNCILAFAAMIRGRLWWSPLPCYFWSKIGKLQYFVLRQHHTIQQLFFLFKIVFHVFNICRRHPHVIDPLKMVRRVRQVGIDAIRLLFFLVYPRLTAFLIIANWFLTERHCYSEGAMGAALSPHVSRK